MNISVIIVNYNQLEKTKVCLASVFASRIGDLTYEAIVLDNASTIGDADELNNEFNDLKVIKSAKNLGMGAGNNLAIKEAIGDYILILNPDTELHVDAISIMHEYLASNADCGLVGPKLIYPDGERQVSCYRFPNIFLPILRRTMIGKLFPGYLRQYLLGDIDLEKAQGVDWLMGSCLMLSRDLFNQLGGFDERFFMYFEDTDLCKKIHNQRLGVTYLPSATVIHHHGRASAKHYWLTSLFINKMARVHVYSYLKYFLKWGFFY